MALADRRIDTLGLRRAPGRLVLPATVAAMVLLAALALALVQGAAALAQHWQSGGAALATVQIPRPTAASRDRAVALLRTAPGVLEVTPLSEAEMAELLRPWLGAEAMAVPMPAVIGLRLTPQADAAALRTRLEAAVPGAALELHDAWTRRIARLARSLEASAIAALLVVAGIAAALVAIATRAGLAARRDAVHIVHGLGATDDSIAAHFAARAGGLALAGGVVGALLALPVLAGLAVLAVPLLSGVATAPPAADWQDWVALLPLGLWIGLGGLPVAAAAIGYATAWLSVRWWLGRLP